ncbi:hypothetical protein ACVIM8_001834 [Bradyrhizobium sp. USDA 4529]
MRALLFGRFRRGDLGLGFLFGQGLFKILDGKLELFNQQLAALRGLPVLFAPCLGQHQLQPLDFQPADRHLALRQRQLLALRKDHRVRSGKIAGSGSEGIVTMTNQPYSPQKIPLDSCRESKSHSLTGSLRTPSCLRHSPVDAGQEIRELRNADRHNAVRH